MKTLTLEQAKKYIKAQVWRGDVYEELWEMCKRAKTIDTLVTVLQVPVFVGDGKLSRQAQHMLDVIEQKHLYTTLQTTRTLYVQKLGMSKGSHYGKFFTPGFYNDQLTIYDLTVDVACTMDLSYRLIEVGRGAPHWICYWDSSLGEMGTVMELSLKLYDDREAILYRSL